MASGHTSGFSRQHIDRPLIADNGRGVGVARRQRPFGTPVERTGRDLSHGDTFQAQASAVWAAVCPKALRLLQGVCSHMRWGVSGTKPRGIT